jgi:hypothetical protein
MSSSVSYAGVYREVALVDLPTGAGSPLKRGTVVEWNAGNQTVGAWFGTNLPIGVTTTDADPVLQVIEVYCGKACSVEIRTDVGIVPNIGDLLFWSSTGVVTNVGTGQAFARAIGEGIDEMVEAVII